MNALFSKVWVRRLLQFIAGGLMSHFLVAILARYTYDSTVVAFIVNILVTPALALVNVTSSWERWGWAIVVSASSVFVFWGLVAMAIGWCWDEYRKRKKA